MHLLDMSISRQCVDPGSYSFRENGCTQESESNIPQIVAGNGAIYA
jgi:hypothetical protein